MRVRNAVLLFLFSSVQVFAAPKAELVVQTGQNEIRSICSSPDGRQVLTAGGSIAVLWDVATGDQIRTFRGHSSSIVAAFFLPSGQQILTVSNDHTARIWDAATGKETQRITSDWALTSAALSPDGKQILAGDSQGRAELWDIASLKELLTLKVADDPRLGTFIPVAFSPDGKKLLTAWTKSAQLWDAQTGQKIRQFTGHTQRIVTVACSPDGRWVLTAASGLGDYTTRLWDANSGTELRRFRATPEDESPRSVAFSPDSRRILVGTEKNARVWDAANGQLVFLLQHSKILNGPQFTINGNQVEEQYVHQVTYGIDSEVDAVAFSADGKYLLTGEGRGTGRLWESASGKMLLPFQGAQLATLLYPSLSSSPDGRQLWTNGPRYWNLDTGAMEELSDDQLQLLGSVSKSISQQTDKEMNFHETGPPVAVAPDGHSIAVPSESDINGNWVRLNLLDGKSTASAPLDSETVNFMGAQLPRHAHGEIRTIAFSPDGRRILTTSDAHSMEVPDGEARLWDSESGMELHSFTQTWKLGSQPLDITHNLAIFSPDSKEILQESGDRIVRLWDASTFKLLASFEPLWRPTKPPAPNDRTVAFYNFYSHDEVLSLGFSPDGKQILLGCLNSGVRLLDKATGKEIWRADTGPHSADEVVSALFDSKPGRILVATRGRVMLLDAATGREISRSHEDLADVNTLAQFQKQSLIATSHDDGTLRFWSLSTDEPRLIATAVNLSSGGWAVVDSQGRFDSDSLDGNEALHWVVSDEPFRPLPFEIFMRQYYTPGLLPRLLAGEQLSPLPGIATLNRIQPNISQPVVEDEPRSPGYVRVRIRVASQVEGMRSSGIRDLRVFRNGRLVKFEEGPLKNREYTFDNIPLAPGRSIEFTAYAFNSDLVKSATVRTAWESKAAALAIPPRTFLVNIGVNRNSGAGCDLRYAVSDAINLRNVLQSRLPSVSETLLVSDQGKLGDAGKEAIRKTLAAIAAQVTPSDTFLLSFSGHGYTDRAGVFYLLPSDLKGDCGNLEQPGTLASAISSDELASWLRPIDAGEMIMILDACHSAASVESEGFRPGPMGSQGLGQLAYDKRIRILTASQSTQVAEENPWIGMGLLSYSLVVDGLQAKQADWDPRDGKIMLREWLQYGVKRVPELYEGLHQGNRNAFRNAPRGLNAAPRMSGLERQNLQTPVLFDFTAKENQGPQLE
jgi:WD40 repeat protein